VHIVRDQVSLVNANLTMDVAGRAPTVVRYVEDDGCLLPDGPGPALPTLEAVGII